MSPKRCTCGSAFGTKDQSYTLGFREFFCGLAFEGSGKFAHNLHDHPHHVHDSHDKHHEPRGTLHVHYEAPGMISGFRVSSALGLHRLARFHEPLLHQTLHGRLREVDVDPQSQQPLGQHHLFCAGVLLYWQGFLGEALHEGLEKRARGRKRSPHW